MIAHMIVSGRVQGVGFRYSVQQKAIEFKLTGWVQNRLDGTVEIEVQGDEDIVERFIAQVQKGFHRFIRVDHIEINKYHREKNYIDFRIRS